jgi:hypothetical protein
MIRALLMAFALAFATAGGLAFAQSPQAPAPAPSQTFDAGKARPFHDFGSLKGLHFTTDADAKAVVDLLLSQFDLKSNYDVFVTDDSSAVPNAQAFYDPDRKRHQIVFNRKFVDLIRDRAGGTPWALYGIAAHEIAHLMALHYERKLDYYTQELEADYFAGFALGKMGVPSYDEAVSFIRALPSPFGNITHPPRARRLAAMGAGWAAAVGAEAPPVATSAAAVDGPSDITKFRTMANRDLYGHDIASAANVPGIPGSTADTCAKACEDTRACKAFVFNRWKGRCFLKDAVVGPTLVTPAALLGVKPPARIPAASTTVPFVFEIQHNKVYLDEPYDKSQTADYWICRQRCAKQAKCLAFTWYRDTTDCQLFDASEGYFYDPSVDSGYRRQDPSNLWPASVNR